MTNNLSRLGVIAVLLIVALVSSSLFVKEPAAAHGWNHKTCFCDAMRVDSNQTITVIKSLDTQLAFHTIAPTTGDRGDCRNKCASLFDNNTSTIANQACAMNMPDGSNIRAAWWIGAQNAQQVRTQTLKVTYGQKCPPDWRSNTDGQLGGITTDGKCKGEFAITSTNPVLGSVTLPPDGTPIGTWGFFWGGGLVAWGTTQNGGAPSAPSSAYGKSCSIF